MPRFPNPFRKKYEYDLEAAIERERRRGFRDAESSRAEGYTEEGIRRRPVRFVKPVKYAPFLSSREQQELSRRIEESSSLEINLFTNLQVKVRALKEQYETFSRSRAISSRKVLSRPILPEEKFYLRIYGGVGLIINDYMRRSYSTQSPPLFRSTVELDIAKAQARQFLLDFKIKNINSLAEISFSNIPRRRRLESSLSENEYLLARAFTTLIDETIEKYSSKFSVDEYFPEDQYLYRIATVKKGAYVNDINPGDIVIDPANWSTSPKDFGVLYRYSNKGMSASKQFFTDNENKEEVLFIIERNSSLKAIDISGYKFIGSDNFSSGEILIKSHTPFRVLAIQDPTLVDERRVIVLRPESLNNIDLRLDNIRSSFNGEIALNALDVPFTEASDLTECMNLMANFELPAVLEEDIAGSPFQVSAAVHTPFSPLGDNDLPFTGDLISFNNPDYDPNHFNLEEGAVGGVPLEELESVGGVPSPINVLGLPEEPFIE